MLDALTQIRPHHGDDGGYDGSMWRLWAVMMAASIACTSKPNVSTPLVGDWFLCELPDCSSLRNHGGRWSSDETWVMIEVLGAQSLDPGATYCASTDDANNGTYTFDETTGILMMTDNLSRDAGSGTFTFAGGTGTFVPTDGTTAANYLKIDPPRLSGACP